MLSKVKRGAYTFPKSFSPAAKSLISGMLQLDPQNRFTISKIKSHECFRGSIQSIYIFPTPNPLPSSNDPIILDSLSPDILDTLEKIGYSDKEQLIDELSSPNTTMAKVFSQMLQTHFSIEQLDWTSSVGNLSTQNCSSDNSSIEVDPIRTNFQVLGSDQFHRHIFNNSASFTNEPLSFAMKVDWSIPIQDNIQSDSNTHRIFCSTLKPLDIMISIQNILRSYNMQWFHPDDFCILCRQNSIGFYAEIKCKFELKKLYLDINLIQGNTDAYINLIKSV